jgi:hypothetical protein
VGYKVGRGWHSELPLPRGERVGVRGFGRLRFTSDVRTPLYLCESPLRVWCERRRQAGDRSPLGLEDRG